MGRWAAVGRVMDEEEEELEWEHVEEIDYVVPFTINLKGKSIYEIGASIVKLH